MSKALSGETGHIFDDIEAYASGSGRAREGPPSTPKGSFSMAFDVTVKREPESTDDMVALGHLAVSGQKPATRRLTKKTPIPREARVAFGVGLGFLVCILLLLLVKHG
jgi:hypothetical protein